MSFGHARMLWLGAIALPCIGWFLWSSWKKRQKLIAQFVQSRLLAQLTVGVSRQLQKARLILLFCAVTFVFLALSGPQWGFTWEEATTRGRDILVAIDTSRSMLAEDVVLNRLARAKLAAIDLMRLAKRDRLGLIAFAGNAFLQCPLTLDEEAFRQSVNILDTGIIPQGGTALSEAIDTAQGAFKQDAKENHKVLVLFTDGEDHETGAIDSAKKAAEAGVRIFTVGVGTANGELLRARDEKGALSYVKDDQGNAVKSRLDEALLQKIATEANGFYLPLQGPNAMEMLYQRGLAPLPTSELSSKMVKKFKERFQWPLGIALLLLVMELFLPDRKQPKRSVIPTGQNTPLAATAILTLLLGTGTAIASPAKALRDYQSGRYQDSANEYSRLIEKNPDDPRLHFNAGTAAYQAQEYEKALKEFSTSIGSPNPDIQQRSYYNLGNSLYRAGEQTSEAHQKSQAWEQALKSYENALKLNPKDNDAVFNRDLVKQRLEELKKQQQEQKKDNQKQDQKDDQDKDKQDKQQQDNKDQQSKDKSDQDKEKQDQKSKDQEKNGNKSEEQRKKEEAEKQAQNQEKNGEKSDDKNQESQQANQEKDKQDAADAKEAAEEAAAAKQGVMTERQAQQLLDAQRSEEKALIFVPPEKKTARGRVFKDW